MGVVAGYRVYHTLRGNMKVNQWPSGQPHGASWYQRINRSHANCLENLPIFACVVLANVAMNATDRSVSVFGIPVAFTSLLWAYVRARFLQSVFHAASSSEVAVQLRFISFVIQCFILGITMLDTILLLSVH